MTIAIFTEVPFNGYQYRDEEQILVHRDGSAWEETRHVLTDISRRHYVLPMGRDNTERQTIDAWFAARHSQYEAFFFKDPLDAGLTNVSIGTGNGVATTFYLPTTGTNRRFYPVVTGCVVKVSGSPVTVSSVSPDARSVTLASPPAGAAPVTITCDVYRLVRLEDLNWTHSHPRRWDASITLVEVVSETG